MPLYEYRCEACEHQFEKIQRFSDDPISVCPSCGQGPVVKLLSSPAIQFKGSGWYITDYARKGGESATPASTSSGGAKPEAAGAKSESTPAAPTATSSDRSAKKE